MAKVETGTIDGYYDSVNNEKGITYDVEVLHVSGKIRTDTTLATSAQDVAGAINELFTLEPGGGDDKWTYPADWIQMTQPEYNQVIAVITTKTSHTIQVYFDYEITAPESSPATVDWGDGVIETDTIWNNYIRSHTYTPGTGKLVANGTEQYKVIITIPDNCLDTHGCHLSTYTQNDIVLACAYGANTKMWSEGAPGNQVSLHQIQLPANFVPFTGGKLPYLQSYRALKKIITPTKLTALPDFFCGDCFSLEELDLSEVQTIGNYALKYCIRLLKGKVNLPKVKTIGDNGLNGCESTIELNTPLLESIGIQGLYANYTLWKLNAPLLTSVGNYALRYGGSLTEFNYASGCTFGTNACGDCPNLYPNPAP